MLKRKTLLIVGAGASAEFNLPIGSELIEHIRNRLSFHDSRGHLYSKNEDLFRILTGLGKKNANDTGRYIDLAGTIRNGLAHSKSIDNFIRTHNTNTELVELCKIAISDVICQCERSSILQPDGHIKPFFRQEPKPYTWLEVFTKNYFAEYDVIEFEDAISQLKIVCFNYDRCIEIFLRRAIVDYFNIPTPRAQEIVDQIEIIHPYGSLGPVWGHEVSVEFASSTTAFDVLKSANEIRTFHEGVSDPSVALRIHKAIGWAESIVFLGFGFLQQNMELLKPEKSIVGEKLKSVYATVKGFSEENIYQVQLSIDSLLHNGNFGVASLRALKEPRKCADLLDSHRAELFGL